MSSPAAVSSLSSLCADPVQADSQAGRASSTPSAASLRDAARAAWSLADPVDKARAAQSLAVWLDLGAPPEPSQIGASQSFDDRLRPGRPPRPLLVHPRDVPARGTGSPAGRAALLHAIAHIEFNAVDLALDAVWRFADMPVRWYLDWASVAVDEARHFSLITQELSLRGYAYGDFEAHDGLWEMAMKTRHDPLDRVALVPRLMEARGLDVTPGLMRRLAGAKDEAAVAILAVILQEEVGHVRIGNDWYGRLCRARNLDPVLHWDILAARHGAGKPQPPFNLEARLQAGFDHAELVRWGAP